MRNPPLFWIERASSVAGIDWPDHYTTDITLRDLFAGMAMQAILASFPPDSTADGRASIAPSEAYALADAMLKERAK